jgi:hypothetical protein
VPRKSEEWWAANESPATVRCTGTTREGGRCIREADAGSVVCKSHGGGAPQVRRRAAERILMTADAAAENLISWMNDPSVPMGVRAKIAQDVMDRAGLVAVQMHKFLPLDGTDPVESLFQAILADPDGLAEPPALPAGPVDQQPPVDVAQEALDRLHESWIPDADVVEIRPESVGKVGPYAYRRRDDEPVMNGSPKPAAPVPGWRPPDDAS